MALRNLWISALKRFLFGFFVFRCATCTPSMLWALSAVRTLKVTLTPFDKAGLEAHAIALRIADGSKLCGANIVEHANCIHASGIPDDPHQFARLRGFWKNNNRIFEFCSRYVRMTSFCLSQPCSELLAKKEARKFQNQPITRFCIIYRRRGYTKSIVIIQI